MDAIIIEGLKVESVIGCFNWERQITQPLLVDLTIHNDLSRSAASDELQDTLNYAEICELTTQVIKQAQPKLIEHAAQLVIEKLLLPFSIESIIITVRKPAIIAQANSVGIRLERHRNMLSTGSGQ